MADAGSNERRKGISDDDVDQIFKKCGLASEWIRNIVKDGLNTGDKNLILTLLDNGLVSELKTLLRTPELLEQLIEFGYSADPMEQGGRAFFKAVDLIDIELVKLLHQLSYREISDERLAELTRLLKERDEQETGNDDDTTKKIFRQKLNQRTHCHVFICRVLDQFKNLTNDRSDRQGYTSNKTIQNTLISILEVYKNNFYGIDKPNIEFTSSDDVKCYFSSMIEYFHCIDIFVASKFFQFSPRLKSLVSLGAKTKYNFEMIETEFCKMLAISCMTEDGIVCSYEGYMDYLRRRQFNSFLTKFLESLQTSRLLKTSNNTKVDYVKTEKALRDQYLWKELMDHIELVINIKEEASFSRSVMLRSLHMLGESIHPDGQTLSTLLSGLLLSVFPPEFRNKIRSIRNDLAHSIERNTFILTHIKDPDVFQQIQTDFKTLKKKLKHIQDVVFFRIGKWGIRCFRSLAVQQHLHPNNKLPDDFHKLQSTWDSKLTELKEPFKSENFHEKIKMHLINLKSLDQNLQRKRKTDEKFCPKKKCENFFNRYCDFKTEEFYANYVSATNENDDTEREFPGIYKLCTLKDEIEMIEEEDRNNVALTSDTMDDLIEGLIQLSLDDSRKKKPLEEKFEELERFLTEQLGFNHNAPRERNICVITKNRRHDAQKNTTLHWLVYDCLNIIETDVRVISTHLFRGVFFRNVLAHVDHFYNFFSSVLGHNYCSQEMVTESVLLVSLYKKLISQHGYKTASNK